MSYLKNELSKLHPWMLNYIRGRICELFSASPQSPMHVCLSICDHFEPLWNNANLNTGLTRVRRWHEKYPQIAGKFRDFDGLTPKYSFFYPEEEYQKDYLDMLGDLCHKDFGEVEIHLHHDKDTDEQLRSKLAGYKELLSTKHGLLSKNIKTGEISYGFIHGNWALDNSHPQGLNCGVNNEIDILQETGCYADFTMPSAPHVTQTTKINSIYYAVDDPRKPKSHNRGNNAVKGVSNQELMKVEHTCGVLL